MDTPVASMLTFALCIPGFGLGLMFWSRLAHLIIGLSRFSPRPHGPPRDPGTVERGMRKIVFVMAASWLIVSGAALISLLHYEQTGWAAVLAGVVAVPLFAVSNFLVVVHRIKKSRIT